MLLGSPLAMDDSCNEFALLWASQHSAEVVVKLLLNVEIIDVIVTDGFGWNAVFGACDNGLEPIAKLLLHDERSTSDRKTTVEGQHYGEQRVTEFVR